MAYKCNSCASTSEESKDCCGAPMSEHKEEAAPEAAPEASAEGEGSTE